MSKRFLFLGVLMTSMMAAAGASANGDAPPSSPPNALKVAEKDFGILSEDGMSAFEDIHLARMAIFDGNTDEAAKFVADAKLSLTKARTDGANFLKAEAALRGPAQLASSSASAPSSGSEPVIWIPIDGRLDVGESFEPTTARTAAVITAKKHLMKGEGAKALHIVATEAIDIDYTLAVAPLEKSLADVEDASKRIAIRDYYGASQALKHAEAGIRFDEIDDIANVKSTSAGRTTK